MSVVGTSMSLETTFSMNPSQTAGILLDLVSEISGDHENNLATKKNVRDSLTAPPIFPFLAIRCISSLQLCCQFENHPINWSYLS